MNIGKGIRYGAVLLAAGLAACSSPSGTTNPTMVTPPPREDGGGDPAQACGQVGVYALKDARQGQVGTVRVWNTQTTLFVRLEAQGSWQLTASQVNAALAAGGSNWWAFPAQAQHDPYVGQFTYAFALGDFPATSGTDLYIAAHAFLSTPTYGFAEGWSEGKYVKFTVQPCEKAPPPPGKDIVVFNDINPFDNTGMANPNNVLMVKNLVNYTTSGPRNAGTKVLFDRGRNSTCGADYYSGCSDARLATMRSVIQGEGFTIEELNSTQGSITNLAPEVKVVFLWNPRQTFTNAEINVFKQFASEGGRLVFVGEWQGYYDAITLENDFLGKMGAVMTNTGQAVDCGYVTLPQASLRPHQITQGMTNVTIACSSVLVPGPNDYPLYYDSTNTKVLSAVATIDPTPLPLDYVAPAQLKTQAVLLEPGLNPNSSTGR